MLDRLLAGRGATRLDRPNYPGRLYRLDDGSVIGLRSASTSGPPGLDINIPGFRAVTKLHFAD